MEYQGVTFVRFDPNNEDHALFLWLAYNSKDFEEFFRRIPKDLNQTAVKSIEAITGAAFYPVYDSKGSLFGMMETSGVDPYSQSCDVGLLLDKEATSDKNPLICSFVMIRFLRFLFETTTLNKVSMRFLAHRTGLERFCKENGMRMQGYFRDGVFFKGHFCPELEYAITRKEYFQQHGEA